MARPRGAVVLVFGESDNDRSVIIEIVRALKPNAKVKFDKRTRPLVLLKQSEKSDTRRKTAEDIARLVKAANVIDNVVAVIAHRDCDAVEPAHAKLAHNIERQLKDVGIKVAVAATPAFESEAWLMLFPEAFSKVCSLWEPLSLGHRHVGSIENAKEFLARALRPKDAAMRVRCPEYSETHGIAIARNAREMGLIQNVTAGRSASFDDFRDRVNKLEI